MPKPRKEAKRTVGKGSGSKGSGGKKSSSSERPAGSGRGVVAEGRRSSAEDPKRRGGAPTSTTSTATSALRPVLRPVGGISLPVASGLAKKIGSPDSRLTPRRLSLPFYGNYCGRGHGDPTGNTPPVDAVDAVCRQHNGCYALLGDFDRRCDRDLIESMPGAIASTPSPIGKNAGLLALLYFSLAERNLALGATLFKRTQQRSAEK